MPPPPIFWLQPSSSRRRRECHHHQYRGSSPSSSRRRRECHHHHHHCPRLQPLQQSEPPYYVFDFSRQIVCLDGPETLDPWKVQTEAIAREMACLSELTDDPPVLPPQQSVAGFVCEGRSRTASAILYGTISGAVWAYMRVLGFAQHTAMDPKPSVIYRSAQMAAGDMARPGTWAQPFSERMAMVGTLASVTEEGFPSREHFATGRQWLTAAIENCVRFGDQHVAQAMAACARGLPPAPTAQRTRADSSRGRRRRRQPGPSCSPTPPVLTSWERQWAMAVIAMPAGRGGAVNAPLPFPARLVPGASCCRHWRRAGERRQ